MKKVIDGKLYNTEAAEKIHHTDYGQGTNGYFETLYRTKNGRYFLAGAGGANSKYAVDTGSGYTYSWKLDWQGNMTEAPAKIFVLDDEQARDWAERNMPTDKYIAHFSPEDA